MKRVLIDTNILVDVLSQRQGYTESLNVLKYCEILEIKGYVSTVTITDLMYILRKHLAPQKIRESVQTLIAILEIVDVTGDDIFQAFASEIKDFEDAVQTACAKRIGADGIITRNLKDFTKSPLPAIPPEAVSTLLK